MLVQLLALRINAIPKSTHCRTTFFWWDIVINTFEPNGINTPAPTAWITRPVIIIGKLNDSAHIIDQSVNSVIAIRNSLLYEYLLIRNALIGIKIPFTNINPVINHCPVDAEILKLIVNNR